MSERERRFTGFWEASGRDVETELAASIKYETVDVLLERLRARLVSVPPGTRVRIDLIAWDGDD
jgi:hypothetical protein